jgi:hypothetical protein
MSVDRCELSDLPVKQCACRIHGPREETTLAATIYAARWRSRCRECLESIEVGTLITPSPMAGGGFVHEECR